MGIRSSRRIDHVVGANDQANIGALEFVGDGLLLIPCVAPYAAMMLTVIMMGALEAVLTTETALGWFYPVLYMVFLSIIGTVHWKNGVGSSGAPCTLRRGPVSGGDAVDDTCRDRNRRPDLDAHRSSEN